MMGQYYLDENKYYKLKTKNFHVNLNENKYNIGLIKTNKSEIHL